MTKDQEINPEHKGFEIIVNARPHKVEHDEVTFDEIVNLAYPDGGRGALISYTILYYEAGGRETEGGLSEGEKVKVKDGTVFNVTRTDRS